MSWVRPTTLFEVDNLNPKVHVVPPKISGFCFTPFYGRTQVDDTTQVPCILLRVLLARTAEYCPPYLAPGV